MPPVVADWFHRNDRLAFIIASGQVVVSANWYWHMNLSNQTGVAVN